MRASVKLQVISHKDVIVNRQRNMILEFSKVQQIFFFYLTSKRQFSSLKMTKLSFRLLLLIQTRGESNHSNQSQQEFYRTHTGRWSPFWGSDTTREDTIGKKVASDHQYSYGQFKVLVQLFVQISVDRELALEAENYWNVLSNHKWESTGKFKGTQLRNYFYITAPAQKSQQISTFMKPYGLSEYSALCYVISNSGLKLLLSLQSFKTPKPLNIVTEKYLNVLTNKGQTQIRV